MPTDVLSPMRLVKLMFDQIHFERRGDHSEHELKTHIRIKIGEKQNAPYIVNLEIEGEKEDEYFFSMRLIGLFEFNSTDMEDTTKRLLLSRNAVAILMPYMRSQVSLLTAQPNLTPVVLPVFNINKMIDKQNESYSE